jgi:ABC-type nickel/cobalt efflux system permease component RcnA
MKIQPLHGNRFATVLLICVAVFFVPVQFQKMAIKPKTEKSINSEETVNNIVKTTQSHIYNNAHPKNHTPFYTPTKHIK